MNSSLFYTLDERQKEAPAKPDVPYIRVVQREDRRRQSPLQGLLARRNLPFLSSTTLLKTTTIYPMALWPPGARIRITLISMHGH